MQIFCLTSLKIIDYLNLEGLENVEVVGLSRRSRNEIQRQQKSCKCDSKHDFFCAYVSYSLIDKRLDFH
jgi:hypothetical protein